MKHTLLLLFFTPFLFAQSSDIVGVSRTAANGGQVFLASVNPSTGNVTDIASNSFSNVLSNFSYTVDPVQDIFYYTAIDTLIGIDINTGALISDPGINSSSQLNFQNFIYNEVTQDIIGLERGANNGGEVYLAKINPVTGIVTTISQASVTSTITFNGGQALDIANQWFHFMSNDRIYTIDIATGNVVYNPLIDNSSVLYFDNIIYNEFDGHIYGLGRNSNPPEIFLGRIDPTTGAVTLISQASIGQSITLAGTTIDPFSNVYYYKSGDNFIGVDITSGTVATSVPLDYTQSNGGIFDYYYYANEKKSLLSNQTFEDDVQLNVYPNPATNYISIEGNAYEKVEIRDVLGKLQLTSKYIASTIDVSKLSSGTYFVTIYRKDKTIVKKLIKP